MRNHVVNCNNGISYVSVRMDLVSSMLFKVGLRGALNFCEGEAKPRAVPHTF